MLRTKDFADVNVKLKSLSAAEMKDARGNKTGVRKVDAETRKVFHWASLTVWPKGSQGGEDVDVFAKVLAEDAPFAVADGEEPRVELVDPRFEVDGRGLSLVCSTLRRADAAKPGAPKQ